MSKANLCLPRISLAFGLVIALFSAFSGHGGAAANRASLVSLDRHRLRSEIEDMRRVVITQDKLFDLIDRKVILVARDLDKGVFAEYSASRWRTVHDACVDLQILDRKSLKPQIRIIRQNSIIQTRLDRLSEPANGLTAEFLETPLEQGDVIILTAIRN